MPPVPARSKNTAARPVLGLVLAAVVGAHLWVIDAWSLPITPDTDTRRVAVKVAVAVAAVTALPVPAAPPAPAAQAELQPLPLANPVTPPPKPRPQRIVKPTALPPPLLPPASTPMPVPQVEVDQPAEPGASSSLDALDEHTFSDAEPVQIALATSARTTTSAAVAAALTAPASARLTYRMKKGALAGTGQIDWRRDAGAYRMRLEARVAVFGRIFVETSEGRLDDSGLAPLRHTERRLKRSERAVSFVRDQGPPRILFSAREGHEPLRPGAQDRLSWIAQLATRLAAPLAGDWRTGSRIEMDVASTGGDVQRWVFTVQGQDSTGLLHLRREPDGPHDTRAEVWTDPRQQHWPVRLQLSEPSGDPLELTLDGLQPT